MRFWLKVLAIWMVSSSILLAQAQTSQIYFLDPSEVVGSSMMGKEATKRKAQSDLNLRELDSEITAQLAAEEKRLNDLRQDMSASEFTPLAEKFDQESEQARTDFDQMSLQAENQYLLHQRRIWEIALSELNRFTRAQEGAVVLNSQFVIDANSQADITQYLINRLDEIYERDPDMIENLVFDQESDTSNLTAEPNLGTNDIDIEQGDPAE